MVFRRNSVGDRIRSFIICGNTEQHQRLEEEDDIFDNEEESLKKSSAVEEELNSKLSILQEEVMENCLEISHLKETLQMKESDLSESANELMQLRKEMEEKDTVIQSLQEENLEIHVLKEQCSQHTDQTTQLNTCIAKITDERDQLQTELSDQHVATNTLNDRIADMEQRLAELNTQLTEKKVEIDNLQQETQAMLNQSVEKEKEQQEQWSSILSQKDAEIDQVTSRCRQLILDREAKAHVGPPAYDTIVKVTIGLFISFLFYLISTFFNNEGGTTPPSS